MLVGIRKLITASGGFPLAQMLRYAVRRIAGQEGLYAVHEFLERLVARFPHPVRRRANGTVKDRFENECAFGVNIAGDISAEGGVAEGVRANIRAVKAAGIPHTLYNLNISRSANGDSAYLSECVKDNPYGVNLVQVNANKVPSSYHRMGRKYFRGKYNIGFWAWELSMFPEIWQDRFRYFDEIWTYSSFCQSALAHVSPIPVLTMMPAIELPEPSRGGRSTFGIPDDQFVFMFLFDYYSVFERKNPLAVVEAFKKAFLPTEPAALVLKCMNHEVASNSHERLRKAARGHSVRFIENYLPRGDIRRLVSCCDVYVSLHRSEGFGFTMAEAMALGKPVIATNYSGNTDFMNDGNSYPVKYRIVELERDCGPYKKNNVWADPDIEDAAMLMRYTFDNRDEANKIGAQAAVDIRQQLSPSRAGERIRTRLQDIVHALKDADALRRLPRGASLRERFLQNG